MDQPLASVTKKHLPDILENLLKCFVSPGYIVIGLTCSNLIPFTSVLVAIYERVNKRELLSLFVTVPQLSHRIYNTRERKQENVSLSGKTNL